MRSSESAIRWTPAYSVGITQLDEQHRQLFATVAKLSNALTNGEGAGAIDSALSDLRSYTEQHFADEELLMAKHHFPALTYHRNEHKEFRKQIAAFAKARDSGNSGVPVALMLFMQRWLKQHVMKTDKQYADFLNARGVQQ